MTENALSRSDHIKEGATPLTSPDLLRALLDASPDFLVVKDQTLIYRAANGAFLRFIGRPESDVIGKSDFDLFPADEAEQYRSDDRRVLVTGEPVVRDEYVSGAEGARWFEVTKVPLRQGDQSIAGVVITVRDITVRKRTEDALRASEERYRHLFEQMHDGYFLGEVILDGEGRPCDFRLLNANPAFEQILGLRREAVSGKTALEVMGEIETFWIETLGGVALTGQGLHLERYSKAFRRYFDVTVSSPGPGLFAVLFRDITERRLAQEALRESEERLQLVTESIEDAFWLSSPGAGRIEYISPAYERIWGRSCRSLYDDPRSFLDGIHPQEREAVRAALPKQADGVAQYEYRVIQPGGAVRWVSARTFPAAFDEHGQVRLVAGIATDITSRKQAEEASRLHAVRFATLLATSPDGICAIGKDGRLLEVNEAYCRMSGYTREELLNLRVADLEVLESPEEIERHIEQIMPSGFDRFETRHRAKNGSIVDVEVSVSHWPATDQMLVVIRDLTERQRAQAALQAERQRLHSLLETLPVYLVLLDADYNEVFANRFFRQRFGDARGRRCYEHLFGRSTPCEVCETFKVLHSRKPLEWEWTGPDGRLYYIHDFPFTDADGSPLIMEVGLDVSDLKRAEMAVRQLNATLEQRVAERTRELEAANKELEAFSYSISHDLQGPLRGINGLAEILREDYETRLDETGQAYLSRMRAASVRMGALIEGLLGLSRIMRSALLSDDVDLSAVAGEIARDLHATDPRRAVIWEIEPGLCVVGDPVLLRALLQNLLDNAWKFTGRRQQAVITLGRRWEEGRAVYFVRDNGTGFEMEHVGKLFQPFERLHTEAEYEGTGIGLATARRIVERHGGRVWAEGESEKGAIVSFTLGAAATAIREESTQE